MELEEVFRYKAPLQSQAQFPAGYRNVVDGYEDGSGSGSDSDFDSIKISEVDKNATDKKLPGARPHPRPQRVQLNRKLLVRGISAMHLLNLNQKDMDEKNVRKKFKEITHLHLQGKRIDDLSSFGEFKNLTVLYLYNNNIDEIIGLESLYNLEVLDLHENKIDRIRGLQGCVNLQKLYLGQNRITMLEGLEKLRRLEELHVEYQIHETGESLEFDPMSLHALTDSLRTLNISGNNLESIEDLAGLGSLGVLIAKDNHLGELDHTALILTTLPSIKKLDLRGNPMAREPKYREKMIGYTQYIENLDGKEIPHTTRDFIQRFQRMKAAHLRRAVEIEQASIRRAKAQAHNRNRGPAGDEPQLLEPRAQPQPQPQPLIYSSGSVEDFFNAGAYAQPNPHTHPNPHRLRPRLPRPLASRHRPTQIREGGGGPIGLISAQSFPGTMTKEGVSSSNHGFQKFPLPHSYTRISASQNRATATATSTSTTIVRQSITRPRSPPPDEPQFMLTTPSNFGVGVGGGATRTQIPNRAGAARIGSSPMLNAVNVNVNAGKWTSVLSPIPAGETEEEGDDEGDPDANPDVDRPMFQFQRPRSPKPSFDDEGHGQRQGQDIHDPEPKSGAQPAFESNVYTLPPWPHIHRIGAGVGLPHNPMPQPVITFIP